MKEIKFWTYVTFRSSKKSVKYYLVNIKKTENLSKNRKAY